MIFISPYPIHFFFPLSAPAHSTPPNELFSLSFVFAIDKMDFPFFYIASYNASQKEIILDEDTSKHIVQVLRMKTGDKINLTDGKGSLLLAEIADAHKKHCRAEVIDSHSLPIAIGITTHDSQPLPSPY